MAQSLDCVFHKKQLRTGKLNKSAGSGLERSYLVALGYLGQKKSWLVLKERVRVCGLQTDWFAHERCTRREVIYWPRN